MTLVIGKSKSARVVDLVTMVVAESLIVVAV